MSTHQSSSLTLLIKYLKRRRTCWSILPGYLVFKNYFMIDLLKVWSSSEGESERAQEGDDDDTRKNNILDWLQSEKEEGREGCETSVIQKHWKSKCILFYLYLCLPILCVSCHIYWNKCDFIWTSWLKLSLGIDNKKSIFMMTFLASVTLDCSLLNTLDAEKIEEEFSHGSRLSRVDLLETLIEHLITRAVSLGVGSNIQDPIPWLEWLHLKRNDKRSFFKKKITEIIPVITNSDT